MKGQAMPSYFDILTAQDKQAFQVLRNSLTPVLTRSSKEKMPENFQTILSSLSDFVNRRQEDKWKRSLVCGFVQLGNKIGLNTRQLQLVINKCKSSINAGFQSIGYFTVPTEPEDTSALISVFPFLKINCIEARQWTMRQSKFVKSQPVVSPPLITEPQSYNKASFSEIPIGIQSQNFLEIPLSQNVEMDDMFMDTNCDNFLFEFC